MNGLEHLHNTFAACQTLGRAALMPYFTLGFPDQRTSLDILTAIAGAGADMLELGIPFSDPLADGPTIQRSTQAALEAGMNVRRCLEMVAELRRRGVTQPLLLMGYYNPLLAYGYSESDSDGASATAGLERFVAAATAAGADGLIVPDLPLEEASALEGACQAYGCALIYLLAPTSPVERIIKIAAHSTGFLYLVSLTGVTGARHALPVDLAEFVARVRGVAKTPLAIGFGISTPEQAREVGRLADGVIVGSALINVVEKDPDPATAAAFVAGLRQALGEAESLPQ